MALAQTCANLRSVNVRGCRAVTGAAVVMLAASCERLSSLDVGGCLIDDAAVMMLAEVAPSRFLSTLRLGRVTEFADEVRTPNARTVSYQGVVAVIVLLVPMGLRIRVRGLQWGGARARGKSRSTRIGIVSNNTVCGFFPTPLTLTSRPSTRLSRVFTRPFERLSPPCRISQPKVWRRLVSSHVPPPDPLAHRGGLAHRSPLARRRRGPGRVVSTSSSSFDALPVRKKAVRKADTT